MSALPLKADMLSVSIDVRKVPGADMPTRSDRRDLFETQPAFNDLQLSQCGSAQAFLPGLPISLRAFFAWHWHDVTSP